MIGEIREKIVSAYQPTSDVKLFTSLAKKDYQTGYDIINKPYTELNDMSVIERDNRDRRTFNAFVDESVEDPDEAWKWRGTRSKARNKAIAMHAQLTAGYIIPMFLAQNDADEEDRDFSDVMRDVAEWMVDNSNYKSSYLMTVMAMLVSPVSYLGAEYAQVYQTIKEKTDKGYEKTEILDEVLSGFQAPVYSCDQILITNAYEQNVQRQKAIFKRRYIDYSEAEAKYGDNENWMYVQPGVRSVFNDVDGQFYDVVDDAHPTLVAEDTYLNRRDDTEVCFLGGVYLGGTDIEANPIRHRDNRNAPKYNIVPFGYQRIGEHYFYYKSLMNAQYWDNQLLDAQYEVGMNRMFLETEMPVVVSGTDKVDPGIAFPSAVTAFKDKDVKVSSLLPKADLGGMFNAMNVVENSMNESSVSDVTGGQLPDANQKATSINVAEQNAKILTKGVGKTLGESMVQYGGLMSDIGVQHLTVPQIMEIAGGADKMKYPTFILKNKVVGGKNTTKVIRFDESLLGKQMTSDQMDEESLKLAESGGYPDVQESIYRVNPELFSKMKYLTRIEPETMFPKNEEFMQAMYMQLQTQFANNPYVSLEALTRKTLYQFFRSDTEELMQKPEQMQPPTIDQNGKPVQTQVGNMALQKGLSGGIPASSYGR